MDAPVPCLFESDSTAIRTFVREMVTQSVVPFMERNVTTWNDQVASRRRGISGRFMSLSKRWTAFGTSSRSSSGPGSVGPPGTAGSNYDPLQGCYRPDAPEARMRKLGDYAFMLRDWKLSQGIYELLRSDFNNDKAWKYHAGAHEMAAISTLLNQQTLSSKVRSETIDQMLETASYSYITRCAAPYGALRCLSVAIELLRLRGGSAADDAARWGSRVLEMRILGATGHALFTERVAASYAARKGAGSGRWGSRRRKSALWNILAADAWLKLGKNVQAGKCLDEATKIYSQIIPQQGNSLTFDGMRAFTDELRHTLRANIAAVRGIDGTGMSDAHEPMVEEESEKLDYRRHRGSLIGGVSPFGGLDAGPLSPMHMPHDEPLRKDDNFE
jgi:trafficking protein particle complex subunit 8